jgi:hypothetical protein
VQGYFAEHARNVNNWYAEAEQELKHAQATAAKYKKDPTKAPEFPAQLKAVVRKLDQTYRDMKADANAYGTAWFGYRQTIGLDLPDKHLARFEAQRNKLINDQKVMAVKFTRVKAMRAEAASLVQVADKATLKSKIKTNKAGQRPINDAHAGA